MAVNITNCPSDLCPISYMSITNKEGDPMTKMYYISVMVQFPISKQLCI